MSRSTKSSVSTGIFITSAWTSRRRERTGATGPGRLPRAWLSASIRLTRVRAARFRRPVRPFALTAEVRKDADAIRCAQSGGDPFGQLVGLFDQLLGLAEVREHFERALVIAFELDPAPGRLGEEIVNLEII